MITIEGPTPGIDPGTSSTQGEHAKQYTKGDRLLASHPDECFNC